VALALVGGIGWVGSSVLPVWVVGVLTGVVAVVIVGLAILAVQATN